MEQGEASTAPSSWVVPLDTPERATPSFKYQPLDTTVDSIRLLVFNCNISSSINYGPEIMHFEMINVEFSTMPKYQALSYTWGSPDITKTIAVNGALVDVRQNLYDALFNLNELPEWGAEVWLWVDAICIDQQNLQERTSQVRLMDFIYTRAQCVIIWLGLPGPEFEQFEPLWETYSMIPPVNTLFNPEALRLFEQWIFGNDYWNRVWIIQEIGLARKLAVFTGYGTIQWENFFHGISHLKGSNDKLLSIETLNKKREDRHGDSNRLETLLEDFWYAKCQEPRDKIYGFLGLAHDCEDGSIEADYSKSLFDVYFDVINFFNRQRPLLADLNGYDRAVKMVRFSQLVQRLLGHDLTPISRINQAQTVPAVRAVGGTILHMGPTFHELYSSSAVYKEWKRSFGKYYSSPADIRRLRQANEAYEEILFHKLGTATTNVRSINPLVFESSGTLSSGVWGSPLSRDAVEKSALDISKENALNMPTGRSREELLDFSASTPTTRLFIGSGLLLGLGPPQAAEGDLLCQFDRTNVVAILRKEGARDIYRLIGSADLSTGHLEKGMPGRQEWIVPTADAESMAIRMDIRTLYKLTSPFQVD
jgi:Heterokaryon incompatibility protein (HET)